MGGEVPLGEKRFPIILQTTYPSSIDNNIHQGGGKKRGGGKEGGNGIVLLLLFLFINKMRPWLTFFLFFLLAAANPPLSLDCQCQNGGLCELDANVSSSIPSCTCPSTFLGTKCEKQGIQLQTQPITANLSSSMSYFYVSFNESTLFYVQILLCPLAHHPDTLFYAHIDFEGPDGSLTTHPDEEDHSFKTKDSQCVVAKYVIFPYQTRRDGELIRLIVQLRTANPDPALSPTPIRISFNLFEFYKMESENLAEFLIISTVCSGLLFCITFAICRRILTRRMRRYVYQPAAAVLNIASFESTMPSSFYAADESVKEEDKECMICLLNVENSFTRVTPCTHLFHRDCIDEWGRKSLTCPACRASLRPLP